MTDEFNKELDNKMANILSRLMMAKEDEDRAWDYYFKSRDNFRDAKVGLKKARGKTKRILAESFLNYQDLFKEKSDE